jgi:hypothetical protein
MFVNYSHSQISIIMSPLAILGIAIQAVPVFFIIRTSISMIKENRLQKHKSIHKTFDK